MEKENSPVSNLDPFFNGWKLAAAIGITFIVTVSITFMYLNHQSTEWSENEISAFIKACRGDGDSARMESGLSETQINSYCDCIQKGVMAIYPESAPLHQIDPLKANEIMSDCFENARLER